MPALSEFVVSVTIPEEPIVPNAVESEGQYMEQKAPNTLGRREGHRFLRTRGVGAIILVAERHVPLLDIEQPVVGDGNSMRIATDILEDLLGTGKGWFGVDHPLGLPRRLQMGGKDWWRVLMCSRSGSRIRNRKRDGKARRITDITSTGERCLRFCQEITD